MSCLYELIYIWTDKFTFPVWMFVPRKPHPKANEYNNMCCGYIIIMYKCKLVEGMDWTKDLVSPEFQRGPGK